MDGSCSAGHRAGTALALAAVVAQCSPLVSAYDKRVIARLFRGNTNFVFTPNTKIPVVADSIVCKSSNVDITMRDCELIFSKGNKTWNRSLTGPQANEIIATAIAAGATSEGAAGSIIENISKLDCTIDPNEIMKKAGGGSQCTFETGKWFKMRSCPARLLTPRMAVRCLLIFFLDGSELADLPRRGGSTPYDTPRHGFDYEQGKEEPRRRRSCGRGGGCTIRTVTQYGRL